MPPFNFLAILLAALVPLIVGAIWYNPNVLGNAIAKENKVDPDAKKGHHPLVYLLTFIASILIAMLIAAILSTHPLEEMTVTHGAFHGVSAAVFMGIPAFAVIALFENRTSKYILIHAFYWLISMGIMGGIIGFFG